MYRFEEYQQAAERFKALKLHNECIACYYFALLHRMMQGLVSDPSEPMTYLELNPPDEDTHLKVRQCVERNKLRGVSDTKRREKEAFNEDLDELYNLRKKADYGNVSLTIDDVLKCEDIYRRLFSKIRTYYPIK